MLVKYATHPSIGPRSRQPDRLQHLSDPIPFAVGGTTFTNQGYLAWFESDQGRNRVEPGFAFPTCIRAIGTDQSSSQMFQKDG